MRDSVWFRVMPGLVPGIHAMRLRLLLEHAAWRRFLIVLRNVPAWMAGTSPAMTALGGLVDCWMKS